MLIKKGVTLVLTVFRAARVVVSTTVLVFAYSAAATAQSEQAQLASRIDALAAGALSRPIAGISVAVRRGNKDIFARGYGLANVGDSVPVTPDTVFHICSISKNILAAVVLKLAEQGKLSLDDEVTKYIPEAPLHGRRVTIRQLLDHVSGIYSFTSLPEADANERLDLSQQQVLDLIKDKPPLFEPGTNWRYDNSGFYMAGMIVERVTKQDYGSYVRDNIFKPIGMGSASLCYARDVVPHLSSGYEREGGKLVNASYLSWKLPFAAGAVCATAKDLLKWQAALNAGRVIRASSLSAMRSPTLLTDGTSIDYGLGTRLGSLDGHPVVGHTGSGGGFGNAMLFYPDDDLSVVVLTNTGSNAGTALALATAIARPLLGLPETNAPANLSVPADELAALTGTFESDEGTVETFAKEGKLHFRVHPAGAEGILLRQSKNVFSVSPDIRVRFVVRDGRAQYSFLYTGGLLMDVARRVQ
jgi:CubicO group peptidase (beta-lactamase class C family)